VTKFDVSISALALAIPLFANPPAQASHPDLCLVSMPKTAFPLLPDTRASRPLPRGVVRRLIAETRGAAR